MHPVSTLLFVLGYTLALPIATRLAKVRPRLLAPALGGYQIGLLLAAGGWALRGARWIAAAHLVWAIVVPRVYRRRIDGRSIGPED